MKGVWYSVPGYGNPDLQSKANSPFKALGFRRPTVKMFRNHHHPGSTEKGKGETKRFGTRCTYTFMLQFLHSSL